MQERPLDPSRMKSPRRGEQVYFRLAGADLRHQMGRTSRRKIRAVTGPMCLNSCNLLESSEGVRAPARRFLTVP